MFEQAEPDLFGNVPEHNCAFLSLDDVKEALEELFEDAPERRWTNETWTALIELGFATYSNELERCEAAVNFVAFAQFYIDWKAKAEGGDRKYSYDLLTTLNVDPFRIGQLIGRMPDFLNDPSLRAYKGRTDDLLLRHALFNLEMKARPAVVAALQEHYGGLSGFFVALWNSDRAPQPADYDENREEYEGLRIGMAGVIWEPPYQETDDEILNDVDDDKMELWTWLDQGAEPLGRS